MFAALAKRFFGTANERLLKSYAPIVEEINACEAVIEKLSDEELKGQTAKFQQLLEEGSNVEGILPEAFATVREAAKRTLGQRHYDVQLLGGLVLHYGSIAEMRTGEGKTLVATLPTYLNALSGKGVHIVTVNDYLAQRDSEWMGAIYRFLGLSVGCIIGGLEDEQRKAAYDCDITYGTNNEFGFDYLRDNMKFRLDAMVQRPFHYAIVDEVDSILIDEARTPLIISGPTEDNTEMYVKMDGIIPKLVEEDYELDEKARTITLSEVGVEHVEAILRQAGMLGEFATLYDIESVSLLHHVNQALRAHHLFQPDIDYIVHEGKVMIIDEFTGRMMEGRRFSEGLHQALEARENVVIQNENQTLASITFQNYFRLYPKLAGMTGTAMTEANEFHEIYNLSVVDIPTNKAVTREDHEDEIYRSEAEKNNAILEFIKECHARKQPMLVGTVSIEKSESLAKLLKKAKINCNVLNARYHEQEAHIIAQAGRAGAVTIATNMAGRGTDIMLGGNPDMQIEDQGATGKEADKIRQQVEKEKAQVMEAGGLCVIGTERHESRRIDNQLRGRSGRQGDPGTTKFFLSLEDDLMRIFGSDRISGMLSKLGLKDGEAIIHPWISRALEKAQQRVEARNYEIRKNLLKFDDVMNDQRKVIFEQRKELMQAEDISDTIADMVDEVSEQLIASHIPEKSYAEQWDGEGLEKEVFRVFGLSLPVSDWVKEEGIADQEVRERLDEAVTQLWDDKRNQFGAEIMQAAEKQILLMTLDQLWKDHLLSLDHLRQGISLRAYGQKDPLNEYKREAFHMFDGMLTHLRSQVVERVAHMVIGGENSMQDAFMQASAKKVVEGRADPALEAAGKLEKAVDMAQPVRSRTQGEERDPTNPDTWGRVSRNELCPCGSGKKYKQCHGAL